MCAKNRPYTSLLLGWLRSSYEKDPESGLYYAGARYQVPRLGSFNSTDPLWWKSPDKTSYHYCANNPVMFVDPDGRKIIVAQKADRIKVLSYLSSIYGKGTFAFDEAGVLSFVGNKDNMSKLQQKSVQIVQKAIDATYDINIKMSNFTPEEIELLNQYDGALTRIEANGDDVKNAFILINEEQLTDITLFDKIYVYMDSDGNPVTGLNCPNGIDCFSEHRIKMKNGKVLQAPKSPEATLIHEIAHPIYEGKNQKSILKEDNLVRRILKIKQRSSSDPEHY